MSKDSSAYHRSYPPPLAVLTATHANKCPLSWLSYYATTALARLSDAHPPLAGWSPHYDADHESAFFCNRDALTCPSERKQRLSALYQNISHCSLSGWTNVTSNESCYIIGSHLSLGSGFWFSTIRRNTFAFGNRYFPLWRIWTRN